jgi:hypothetical protein
MSTAYLAIVPGMVHDYFCYKRVVAQIEKEESYIKKKCLEQLETSYWLEITVMAPPQTLLQRRSSSSFSIL